MKVAIFSESSADEAALRVLVDALVGQATETVPLTWLRSRGWPSVQQTIGKVIYHLYYQTDADALVVVADSNSSALHVVEHEAPGATESDCRLCALRREAKRAISRLRPMEGRAIIKTAIGIAAPAIEAWFRCGLDVHVTEAAWQRALHSRTFPFTRLSLKKDVYGTDRPSLERERECMLKESKRLALNLAILEGAFPIGFGALAKDARGW